PFLRRGLLEGPRDLRAAPCRAAAGGADEPMRRALGPREDRTRAWAERDRCDALGAAEHRLPERHGHGPARGRVDEDAPALPLADVDLAAARAVRGRGEAG